MKIKSISALVLICLMAIQQTAFATNGSKLIGTGAVSPVMGGTGAAEPQDTAGLMINPAGLTKVGNRIDTAIEFALIDAEIDTSQSPHAFFKNSRGPQGSEDEHIWIPQSGFARQFGDSDWYYGFATGITSGLKVDYKASRLSETVTSNDFDKHIELYTMEFVPTVAYKPIEKLSVGVSPVLTMNYLKGDISTSAFTETEGRNHTDIAFGMGFNLGLIYDVSDHITAAFSYKSNRWNDEHHRYDDVAKNLDGAAEYIFGIAVKPVKELLIESNAKFIDWTSVPALSKGPQNHGYGWKSQWVFGIGAQYTFMEKITLRAGYNYGDSPIRNNVVYANALTSLISEHHMGIGLGYKFNERFSMDTGWIRTFANSMTETGLGDAYSVNGKGTVVKLAIDSFVVGFSYHFD